MSVPYSYTDPDGDSLNIFAAKDGGARLIAYDACDGHSTSVRVLPDKLPGLVAALYEAAGLPAPVVLRRDEVADDWVRVTGTGGAA